MTTPGLSSKVWRASRHLLTHRGKLVYFSPGGADFAQGEADLSPKNLIIAQNRPSGWQLVHLHDEAIAFRSPNAVQEMLWDPAQHTVIDGVIVEQVPGLNTFALRKDGLYLSVDPKAEVQFEAKNRQGWETFEAITPGVLAYQYWRPVETMGGTQLMLHGLKARLGSELDAINLQLHQPDRASHDARPLVVWLHNGVSNRFAWCGYPRIVDRVAAFVFVSNWQRQLYLDTYPTLPPERCYVINNATESAGSLRSWSTETPWRWRCAYISAPDRGLTVLLDAWEQLDRPDAELHIWSSFRLWGPEFADARYHAIFMRAQSLPGVVYHGIRPNSDVRSALRDMHFLTYPATVNETACLAVMEAMNAGLRVVTTARAALPETAGGFAHLYNPGTNHAAHVAAFMREMVAEFQDPWIGQPERALAMQQFAREAYGWPRCVAAWRSLIARLTASSGSEMAPAAEKRQS